MVKRPHCCVFLIGMAVLLVAVVFVVCFNVTTSHAASQPAQDALRVATALDDLESGCLTCHTATNRNLITTDDLAYFTATQVPSLTTDSAWPVVLTAAAPGSPRAANQAATEAQLRDLGQRILALSTPVSRQDAQQFHAVSNAFVALVAATRMETDTPVMQHVPPVSTLHRVATLAQWIEVLEHRASPQQWRAPETQVASSAVTLAVSSPAPGAAGIAALCQPVHASVVATDTAWAVIDTQQYITPVELAYVVLRHGPPADVYAYLDSVL